MTMSPSAVSMPSENFYRLLGVEASCPAEQIRLAVDRQLGRWRLRAAYGSGERRQDAQRVVRSLWSASVVLLNPEIRARYDEELTHSGGEAAPAESTTRPEATPAPQPGDDPAIAAWRLIADGRLEEALMLARRATEGDPTRADLWAVRGYAESRLRNHDQSVECMRKTIELRPDEPTFCADIAFAYEEADRWDEALPFLQKAAALDASLSYRASLGWLYVQRGMYREAVDVLESAARNAPDDPSLAEQLARARLLESRDGWVEFRRDGATASSLFPTDRAQLDRADSTLSQAMVLRFDDATLRHAMEVRRDEIEAVRKRQFTGNGTVAMIAGFVGLPLCWISIGLLMLSTSLALLYLIASCTPRYKVIRQLAAGKPIRGLGFLDAFLGPHASWLRQGSIYTLGLSLFPLVIASSFIENYYRD